MAYESGHRLDIAIAGRSPQTISFHVVGNTGVSAAAWRDGTGVIADLVFERAPQQAPLAAAIVGATPEWSSPTHLRLRWSVAPPRLDIPPGLPAARGSVLSGPMHLDLEGLSATTIRRITTPAVSIPVPVSLTAFSVGSPAGQASARAHMARLGAVAPTGWRAHPDGSLTGSPDPVTVAMAQASGTPLWPVLMNDAADSSGSGALLGDATARGRLTAALMAGARVLGARGVHLDFEGISGGDRDRLSKYVDELGLALHAAGMKLAVDVVPHRRSGVNTASAAYDLPAIAASSDFIVLMSYDQHTASSGPGPVAGRNWQADVLAGSLAGLAPNRVLMGIPLYARRWSTHGAGASDYASAVAAALSDAGVHYDYDFAAATPVLRAVDSGGGSSQTWFDDADSLARKLAPVTTLGLAGAAAWRLGFEDPAFWSVLA